MGDKDRLVILEDFVCDSVCAGSPAWCPVLWAERMFCVVLETPFSAMATAYMTTCCANDIFVCCFHFAEQMLVYWWFFWCWNHFEHISDGKVIFD